MTPNHSAKHMDITQLDALTKGAFSAQTAGERASRVREWLATQPASGQLADVFKELSVKDKGAAKLVRERIDEIRRAKGQEMMVAEWASKGQTLLAIAKLNIADAMAWQRDAAKAGAPLSKEPLATLKLQLAERVRCIEDLQHQVQVQREAAVLLAQRIEILSTKPWKDAEQALPNLRTYVEQWQVQADSLVSNPGWPSVDMKFPTLLEASRNQLLVVRDAFQAAFALALSAANDPSAPLPPVPVWADELRAARGLAAEGPAKAAKPVVDPEVRAQAVAQVKEVLGKLEAEVGEGHGKASAGAAAALRQALKEFGKLIPSALENQSHAALAAAGELEGWQRWRADQLREELVTKAESLLKRPEGQAIGGRKMQENLRTLREQWKLTDQGGVPNHALWKRFDEACNEAHKVVEVWLEKLKAETALHKAERLALIEEVNTWAEANRTALDDDWKGFNRVLHQFGERWREGGHVGEKLFAELQPLWKEAIGNAAAPLEALQAQSLALRQAMVEEAKVLCAAQVLRVDAVKALQQRWQAEAHRVPLERRQEQKLWDAFRKPIDDAFNRKTEEREKAQATLNARDRSVLDAAKALEAANAAGDAQAIRAAMAALDAALRGQALAQAEVKDAGAREDAAQSAVATDPAETPVQAVAQGSPSQPTASEGTANAAESPATGVQPRTDQATATEAAPAAEPAPATATAPETEPIPLAPAAKPRPVVAVRGDDRPGMKKDTPAPAGRAGKWNDRKDGARTGRDARPDEGRGRGRGEDRPGRNDAWQETPRLGDAAFRAQREALENAQQALKKLAAQAHGEALTQLMNAWEQRDASLLPTTQELGAKVSSATRTAWQQAVSGNYQPAPKSAIPAEALLRLEMAAEVPTPADHMGARRMLQLQLLTRRNDPSPAQTWGQDAAVVLAAPYSADDARRLQNAVKVLLKP